MAVAIEDTGFQIRDQIMWVYGSGFPKSLNIAKAIDKASGFDGKVVGKGTSWNRPDSAEGDVARMNISPGEYDIKELSAEAQQWQGWGTALKPAHEPLVLARKPLIGTVADNVMTYGTGGLNIDGSRVGTDGGTARDGKADEPNDSGWENMRGHGVAQLNAGRWPANVIHDGSDEVVALFPDTKSGAIKPYVRNKENVNVDFLQGTDEVEKSFDYGDSGSAARFFYCAKANKKDRNEGLDGFEEVRTGAMRATADGSMLTGSGNERTTTRANYHPTVKPTDLMRYLCRLITPPQGIVLDPFMGSGSTGKGAILEGFDFIGIEQDADYMKIAQARIEFAINKSSETLL
jgi:site-specific DNA-methyltransferase (adenine-specific)